MSPSSSGTSARARDVNLEPNGPKDAFQLLDAASANELLEGNDNGVRLGLEPQQASRFFDEGLRNIQRRPHTNEFISYASGCLICPSFYGARQRSVLLAGEPKQLAEKLPQAMNLNAFPTTFILGRDGRVRAVHAGVPSPGSGTFYEEAERGITEQVERLLARARARSERPLRLFHLGPPIRSISSPKSSGKFSRKLRQS